MEKRRFDKLGIETSLLGFGCMRFPLRDDGGIDEALAEKIKSIIEKLIENSNTSVQTMNSVVDEIKRQNDKIDDTKSVFGVLKTEIDSVTAAIENLAEKVEDINGLKNSVTESVESLAAIAQENAAGTEETSASMVELSQIVNDCNQDTSKLVGLSQELQDDIGKFKLKGQLDNI